MLLRQIYYFQAVVKYQSFTKAAEECYISQSAISQQIKLLEKDLDVVLFQKGQRHVQLTKAGEYFYKHTKTLLIEIENVKKETQEISKQEEINLTIGYPKNFPIFDLQQLISKFSQEFPEVNISLVSGNHEELYEALKEGVIDLKISEQRRVFHEDYQNIIFKKTPTYIEISNLHPLSYCEYLTIDDLKNETCILIASNKYKDSERYFYENDLQLSHHFIFVDTLEQARFMVINNKGYLPLDYLGNLLEIPGIKRIALYKDKKALERTYFLCFSKKFESLFRRFCTAFNQLFLIHI